MANIPKPVDMTQKNIPFLKVGGTTKVITNAESGCFFRAGVNFEYYLDLVYDELKKNTYDITTQASVNIGVFADDIFSYVADIWYKYYSEEAVNYYNENKGDSEIKSKFHRKFSSVAKIPNGRKVQLAIGFKPLLSADAYLGDSFTNAKWGNVTWVQYDKKIINDQIHYQKDYICGCHIHKDGEKKYSRIDNDTWCYPGGTKDTHKDETFKSLDIDKYTTFEVDTIPCNYKGITWTLENSGYRFGAIHLKVLARIEHDGKKDRYFSGDFDGSPNFDKAKLADKPIAKKDEWDAIGEKIIIFKPIDCRYPYQTEFKVKNYYNAPIGMSENSEFDFTSNELKKIYNNGPRCEVQIQNKSVELRRKFDYLYEEKYQQDTVVNDNAGGLWLKDGVKAGNSNWYNLFTRESASTQGLKKAHFKTAPINGNNRTVKFTIGRYGTFYDSMEYEKTLELTPKDVSKTPNITIKNTIDSSGNIKRVANLKSMPSNMCIFLENGNKWKKYYKNSEKKTVSVYNQDFPFYNKSTYSFRYVSFTKDENVSYPLIYNEATFEVKPPNIDLTMTNKGSESLDNSIKLGDEVEYEIKASGDIDGDGTLDNIINLKYRLYIKKQNNITIKSIDGEPAVLGINSDYYISKESLNKHTVTIVFDKYTPSSGSNNDIEVQFYGVAQYGNGNGSIDLKDEGGLFKAYFEFPHLFHQNNVDKPSVQLRTVYIKDNTVIPIYPIIISKPKSPSTQSGKLGGSENS